MANDESTFVTSRQHSFAPGCIAHMRDRGGLNVYCTLLEIIVALNLGSSLPQE